MSGMGRMQAISVAVGAATMVATPLSRQGGTGRRALSTMAVASAFLATLGGTGRRWGIARGTVAAAAAIVGTMGVERVGTRTGIPFGRYRYTSALQPQVFGVPAIVPLAWFSMAVPAREVAHAALGDRSAVATRILGGAAALTAWDLFLDPQMVGEGYWRWSRRGAYRGVPVTNFFGWFVTSLGVMSALEVLLPPAEPAPDLVAEYGFMAAMETVGFAAFFRDRTVAVVGGAAMLPVAMVAAARLVGHRS